MTAIPCCFKQLSQRYNYEYNTPYDDNRLHVSSNANTDDTVCMYLTLLYSFILKFLPGVDKSQTFDGKC
jgi:hypothetical protein